MTSRFQRGSGCYTCRACGKLTRETVEGESSVKLCRACLANAERENEHLDGLHADKRDERCALCCAKGEGVA